MEKWIDFKIEQPKFNGEYLVTWNLNDNEYPVVTSMDYEVKLKQWFDPRGTDKDCSKEILYWMELPSPKKDIPIVLWKEEPVNLNNVYGHCMHGENMANCEICNSYK